MQLIINRINNINDDWYKSLVQGEISNITRSSAVYTAKEVAVRIAQIFSKVGREGYLENVDTSKMPAGAIRESDQYEVWFYDPNTDDSYPVVRVGADAKNNIHINSAPRKRQPYSIEIEE